MSSRTVAMRLAHRCGHDDTLAMAYGAWCDQFARQANTATLNYFINEIWEGPRDVQRIPLY